MIQKLIAAALMTFGLLACFAANSRAAEAPALQYGLYIHFGMDTFRHAGEKGQLPVERFAPTGINVNGWAHAAKQAGMTFAVLTAKHESGFCLWESKDYDYDSAHSAYKGDVLGDFVKACKAEGIVPGVHYSTSDAHNEGAVRNSGVVPPPYFNVIKQHFTELNSKYPEIGVLILDGSTRLSPAQLEELRQLVKRLNPQCAFWKVGKDGLSGTNHVSATVIRSWMWAPAPKLNTAQQLFSSYQRCLAAGKAFVLNVGPDTSGNIPGDQIAVLTQLKSMIANPPPAASAAPGPDAAARLKEVKQLFDQGLINKEEYVKKVKEIMDSL
jgi:alpha-L-fucosidase